MEKVRDLLNGIGLGAYVDKFEEEGWDNIDTVLSMTKDDIRTCIGKPGHARTLWLKLQHINNGQGIQEQRTKEDNVNTGNSVTPIDEPKTEKSFLESKAEDKPHEALESPISVEDDHGNSETDNVSNEEIKMTELPKLTRKSLQEMRPHTTEFDSASRLVNEDAISGENRYDHKNDILDRQVEETTENSGPIAICEAKASTSQEEAGHLELLPDDILHDYNDNMAVVGAQGISPMVQGTMEVRAVINSQGKDLTAIWRTNTRIPGNCTVVENSENVTIAKNVEIHHHKIQEPKDKSQITTILEYIQKRHEDLHVTTRALREAKYILEDRHWVVIAGNPGDGKTWMGHQLLLDHMSSGYEPLFVTSPFEWREMVGGKESRKQIVFIDDIFGSVYSDDRTVDAWMPLLENTEILLKARKGELLVVCTTRKFIWTDVCPKLNKYKSFEAMRLLDLSLYDLDTEEKMKLLGRYGSHFEVDINSDFLNHQTKTTHGFPHCVEMFCTNKNLRRQGEQHFFSSPLEFLEKDIVNLYKSHSNKFCALVMLLITERAGQKVCVYGSPEDLEPVIKKASRCCLVDQTPSFCMIKEYIQQLSGVYIEQDESGNVKFKHPSFIEVISLLIAKEHPLFAIDILDIEFLVQRTKCCNYTKSPQEDVIILPNVCFEQLAKRLTDTFRESTYALNHQAFTNRDFVNVWLKYVSSTREGYLTFVEGLVTKFIFKPRLFLPFSRNMNYFLCLVPVTAMDALCPALLRCEILQEYWESDKGKSHLACALAQAYYENCSAYVIETLKGAGANID